METQQLTAIQASSNTAKHWGKVNSLCGVRASTALTFPKSAPKVQVRCVKVGLDSLETALLVTVEPHMLLSPAATSC